MQNLTMQTVVNNFFSKQKKNTKQISQPVQQPLYFDSPNNEYCYQKKENYNNSHCKVQQFITPIKQKQIQNQTYHSHSPNKQILHIKNENTYQQNTQQQQQYPSTFNIFNEDTAMILKNQETQFKKAEQQGKRNEDIQKISQELATKNEEIEKKNQIICFLQKQQEQNLETIESLKKQIQLNEKNQESILQESQKYSTNLQLKNVQILLEKIEKELKLQNLKIQEVLQLNSNISDQLKQKTSQCERIQQMHQAELEYLKKSIKNECSLQIQCEIQNYTNPLLEENKILQDQINRLKQQYDLLLIDKEKLEMSNILNKMDYNQAKNNIPIVQLKQQMLEIKKKSDIWKFKYKKIKKEMNEVQEQFEEYTKIMIAMKDLQNQMESQQQNQQQSIQQQQFLSTLDKYDLFQQKLSNQIHEDINLYNQNNNSFEYDYNKNNIVLYSEQQQEDKVYLSGQFDEFSFKNNYQVQSCNGEKIQNQDNQQVQLNMIESVCIDQM